MSTQSPNIVLAATNPTQHYNWISAFSNALDSLGVARTSDTGQIALVGITSIVLPPETAGQASTDYSNPPVFEIRKLSASGFPDLFMRFDYGIVANRQTDYTSNPEQPNNYPAITVSIGSATDGAGNLVTFQPGSGIISFASANVSYNSVYAGSSSLNSQLPSSNAQECDFASDGQNYLTIMLGENAPTYESRSVFCFGIERTIDPTLGSYDNSGFCGFSGHDGGNSHWFYVDALNQQQWNGISGMPSIAPPFNIGGSVSTVDIFPFIGCTTVPKGAPTVALAYYASGINSPVSFPATLYSSAHTYKACPRTVCSADSYNTGTRLALRFD
jgi:hypothetical protein